MKTALKKEIKAVLKDRAHDLVKEHILPDLYDNMDDYVGMMIGKLENIDDDKDIDEAAPALYEGVLEELTKQIKQGRPSEEKITRKK